MSNVYQQHGAFSWAELMTTDPEAAKSFYSKLFGWSMKDMPMEGMTYTVLGPSPEQQMGGLMQLPPESEGCPPHWGVYVTVDDVDSTAETAEALGGKLLVPPRDIPNVGRFCVIQDPQGAVLAAITYAVPDGE